MGALYLGNYGCEHKWAEPRRALPAAARRAAWELASTWIAITRHADRIWLPAAIEPGFEAVLRGAGLAFAGFAGDVADVRGCDRLVPWGAAPAVRETGRDLGLSVDAPATEAARSVNARSFRLVLEQEFGIALPGSCRVRMVEDLCEALAALPADRDLWVLKAEYGMSGRERFLGRGHSPAADALGWLRRREIGSGGDGAVFEPWVDRIDEASVHFTIAPGARPPQFEGVTPFLVDDAGHYRGSRFEPEPALETRWAEAIDVGRRVAERLAALGYHGPLGIDACRYRDAAGGERMRPLQDLNARYTMGRLALGLRRLLAPHECGTWCHVRWPGDGRGWFEALAAQLPSAVRLVRTSPFTIGDRPVSHGTFAVVGPPETVRAAESIAFDLG